MEGVLKQQIVAPDGMYTWQRKLFRIDEYGNFLVKATNGSDDAVRLPLSGAKYAKEWAFSSAISGYGFDIIWSNDDVWSLLVDDENSCLKWVAAINAAIRAQKTGELPHDEHESGIRNGRDGIASVGMHHASEDEYAMRTIEKHQQFLAATSQSSLNTTQPYNDAAYSSGHQTMADSMRKSRERDTGGGYFDDLPTDIKQLRSLQPTSQLQSAGQHRSRYDGHSHSASGSHAYAHAQAQGPFGDDADSHQEDGESQQSQPSYAPVLDSSRHTASLPSSIVSGGGGAIHAEQQSSYRPSSAGGAVNTSQSHMDYFRSDVSKALFDQTGASLFDVPPPPAPTGAPTPNPTPAVRTDQQRNDYLDNMRSIFASTKKSLVDTEQELASLRSSQPHPDHLSLQIRCQHLEQQLQVKEQEVERAQRELYQTKLDFEDRVKKLNDELDAFRTREHDILAKFKQEIDHRVLRASNENSSYFEASLKSLKAQHQRELRLLQDELNEERKNGTTQVEKEITLRKRAEANDASLRKELMQAQDRIAALEIDLQRTQVTTESAQSSWSREKSRLVAEYTHQIQQLTAEKEAIELDAQRQVQAKVQEMNKKWETSIQTLKGHEMELTRQQWESEHARSLIELQKKCQRDIESVRSEERTLAAQEIESLRGAFLQRERQTTQDLIELEKLHAKRVQQLEFQYQQEKTANEQLKQRLNDLLLDQDRRHHDTLYQSDAWQRKNHEMTLQCDQLKRDLKSMQEEVANSKAGENNAREQLRQLSMEMKLLQAERAELQRQATGHGVEVSQWKQVVQEQEKNYHAIETTARVAKEEIAFLEHENHRLKTENAKLRFDVEKADRLIYGVSQHQADPKRSYPMKLDAKFHEAAGTAAPTGASSTGNGMNTSAISNAGTTVFGTATQATPSRQATPSQRPPTVPGSATSATGTSKLGLDTTVLPHSRHSFHRHTLHSPTESNRSRSPRRLSPTHASATFSSASRSASAKRR